MSDNLVDVQYDPLLKDGALMRTESVSCQSSISPTISSSRSSKPVSA